MDNETCRFDTTDLLWARVGSIPAAAKRVLSIDRQGTFTSIASLHPGVKYTVNVVLP